MIADGLLVAALQTADDAEVVQRSASPKRSPISWGPLHGFPQESGGLLVPTLLTVDIAQVVQRARLAADVAGAPEQHQGPMEEDRCLLVITQAEVNTAEVGQCGRLGGAVPDLSRGAGVTVDGDGLGVVAARVKVAEHGGRQAGGMTGPALVGGVPGGGDQSGPLSVQPGPGRGGLHRRGRGGRRWPGMRGQAAGARREQRVHRRRGGVQVVVEQAGQRCPPFGFGVRGRGELARVGAQQVMHAVPARAGGLDQVRPGQQVEQPACLLAG